MLIGCHGNGMINEAFFMRFLEIPSEVRFQCSVADSCISTSILRPGYSVNKPGWIFRFHSTRNVFQLVYKRRIMPKGNRSGVKQRVLKQTVSSSKRKDFKGIPKHRKIAEKSSRVYSLSNLALECWWKYRNRLRNTGNGLRKVFRGIA